MKAIVAVDNSWGIGREGNLLYRIKEDIEFFKEMTVSKVVVMGRKTFESLPNGEPLKNRVNLVITSNKSYENNDNVIFGNITEINNEIKKYNTNDIFIIGGECVYKEYLHRCDTVYVTHYTETYESDTYMPNLAFEGFMPKQILDSGTIDDKPWAIMEWITSECKSYKSVLWCNDLNNNILFLYSNFLNHWNGVFSNKLVLLRNDFKIRVLQLTNCGDIKVSCDKINNCYRSEIFITKDKHLLRVASFGATLEEADKNLTETITNLLI
jgi:dihydrofolate reductase